MLNSELVSVWLVLNSLATFEVSFDSSNFRKNLDGFVGSSFIRVESIIVIVEVRGGNREAVIDRIVADLARFKPVVLRRFDIPLGFSLSIERTGLSALQQHPAVLKTQVDMPMPPTGGGRSAPQ